jgi:hypothetical protein
VGQDLSPIAVVVALEATVVEPDQGGVVLVLDTRRTLEPPVGAQDRDPRAEAPPLHVDELHRHDPDLSPVWAVTYDTRVLAERRPRQCSSYWYTRAQPVFDVI